jgi:hypothetical protein
LPPYHCQRKKIFFDENESSNSNSIPGTLAHLTVFFVATQRERLALRIRELFDLEVAAGKLPNASAVNAA